MPHDPKTVKLRPGAATKANVKLYPWTSAGALTITETDQGTGTDQVYVNRIFDIIDSGSGAEVIQALVPTTILIQDTGAGDDAVYAETVGFTHRIKAILLVQPFPKRAEIKRIRAILRIYHAIILEENLSPSKDPARLIELRLPTGLGDNTVKNVRSGWIQDDHDVTPLLKGAGPAPSGYHQANRSVRAAAYLKGRNQVLDANISDTDDSPPIELLEFHCIDPEGRNASVYLVNARIKSADPLFKDRAPTIYEYKIVADYWTFTPPIGILKLTYKPISAPLTITLIHPIIYPLTTTLVVIEEQDLALNAASLTAIPRYILEQQHDADPYQPTAGLDVVEDPEEPATLTITASSEADVT